MEIAIYLLNLMTSKNISDKNFWDFKEDIYNNSTINSILDESKIRVIFLNEISQIFYTN